MKNAPILVRAVFKILMPVKQRTCLIGRWGETMADPQTIESLFEHAVKIGERKYDEEIAKEEALISQASQMQTVFSIVTAVLFAVATILVDHRGNIPKLFFIISITAITLTIGACLVLASFVHWRYKTNALPDLSELRKYTFESDEWESLTNKTAQLKQYYNLLQEVQAEKCRLNNKRVKLIIASIICFWISVAESFVSGVIAVILVIQ